MINKLKTNALSSFNFEKEKTSVKKQFWFFLLAYVTRVVFFGSVLLLNPKVEEESFIETFAEAVLYIPWNAIPVAMILFEHFRTFKLVGKQRRREISDDQTSEVTADVTADEINPVQRKLLDSRSLQGGSLDSEELQLALRYDKGDKDTESANSSFTDGRSSPRGSRQLAKNISSEEI